MFGVFYKGMMGRWAGGGALGGTTTKEGRLNLDQWHACLLFCLEALERWRCSRLLAILSGFCFVLVALILLQGREGRADLRPFLFWSLLDLSYRTSFLISCWNLFS
jgi:hypothetical protein